jgi:NAD(P)-dependent dehydrogenase (short-subunit alcohol dehydrogenase family)
MSRKKAFVTGASRGIGKAIALRLAKGGYDVAITARTVAEGESREHSSTLKQSNTKPLPGSLSSTADLMRAEGADVLVLPADLIDRPRSAPPPPRCSNAGGRPTLSFTTAGSSGRGTWTACSIPRSTFSRSMSRGTPWHRWCSPITCFRRC